MSYEQSPFAPPPNNGQPADGYPSADQPSPWSGYQSAAADSYQGYQTDPDQATQIDPYQQAYQTDPYLDPYQAQVAAYQQHAGYQMPAQNGYQQPTYGMPMPDYAMYPYAIQPAQSRPGTATAAGVLGIVFGSIGLLFGFLMFIGFLAAASFYSNAGGTGLVFAIASVLTVIGSAVGVFVGGILLLSGRMNIPLVVGGLIGAAWQLLGLLGAFFSAPTNGGAAAMMILALASSATMIGLALAPSTRAWLAAMKAVSGR